MFIDIHTHNRNFDEATVSKAIYNIKISDLLDHCMIEFRHAFYSLGIHPCEIAENLSGKKQILEKYVSSNSIKAIGESGLDKTCNTDFDLQKKVFTYQIRLSESLKKPIIIHCVKAFDELLAIKKELNPQQIWIFHNFRGKPEQMKQLLRKNFYFSSGIYFNEKTIKQIPLHRLFFETDDHPVKIQEIYHKILTYLPISEEELISQMKKNFAQVFLNRTFADI